MRFPSIFFLFLLFVDLIHFGEPLCVGYCDRGRPTYEFSVCFTTYIGYSTLHIFGARMAGGSWMTVLAVHVVLCVFAVCVCVCVLLRSRVCEYVSFLHISSSFYGFQLRNARVTERATQMGVYPIKYIHGMYFRCDVK